jgi:superfamily II DNA or RNA helicase
MSTHDVIDNRNTKLIDHLRTIMDSTESAKFAVGYFFLSGLEGIADKLETMKELKILVGNTTNRETLEQLAEGYRRLELVQDDIERQSYRRRTDARQMAEETAGNVRESIELGDQTDQQERTVHQLVRMIEQKRLKVRIYTKGRLHAKAYIFDYGPIYDLYGKVKDREEKGIGVVGSSNLTLAGVTHNTELNVVVHGNSNHAALTAWFNELWEESEDFDERLLQEMKQSWVLAEVTPYELYLKTLYRLVKDRLDEDATPISLGSKIESKLADFQKTAVRRVSAMIKDYGGGFVADVVGLGKSFIGAAIIKRHEQQGMRPLIICPPPLKEMWEAYNEEYELNAQVLSAGLISNPERAAELLDPEHGRYRDRDFVLIDESHNFRSSETQRYAAVQKFMETGGRKLCLLTATPRNKTAWDVYHQMKLFQLEDKTTIPIDPPDLKSFFRQIENGQKKLPAVLQHVLYRRLRNDIIRWYGFDERTGHKITEETFAAYKRGERRAYVFVGGRKQFFPRRKLETIRYSIEQTYDGLYDKLRGYLGRDATHQQATAIPGELTYARYGLFHYVRPDKCDQERYQVLHRAGRNLRGLVRVLMFKRFESSVYAFRCTVERLLKVHRGFLTAMDAGIVPAGEEAQTILYESDIDDDVELVEALRDVEGKYDLPDFDSDRLRRDIAHDIALLEQMREMVRPITPQRDDKLQTLRSVLKKKVPTGKCLIFTQYADTAAYLEANLTEDVGEDEFAAVYSSDKSKLNVVARFAPRANEDLRRRVKGPELRVVVSTDVLSEGLNLQDCDRIINYDLHWNPVRLIQRFGRIDRIGSDHSEIFGHNFLPEKGIERNLGLEQVLKARINEIHETIGEDSVILDDSEKLNDRAMYAIYEGNAETLSEHEDDEHLDVNPLSEAEELLRDLRSSDPALFNRIASMRDGVRSARKSTVDGYVVFCEAGSGADGERKYQQLFHIDSTGNVVTRDLGRVLSVLACKADEPTLRIPRQLNEYVMQTRRLFAEEVKHRESEYEHAISLSLAQKFVMRELRILFGSIVDEDLKAQINLLERAFRHPLTDAVRKELNQVRRQELTGPALLESLKRIYTRHGLHRWLITDSAARSATVAKVVCSEALST